MAQDLVSEREAELRRGVRARRACLTGTRRQRLGWTLVEVGLRLAVESEGHAENVGARDFRV